MSYHTNNATSNQTPVAQSSADAIVLSNSQVQLGDLSFQGIKDNIIEYLKRTDSPLNDLDFTSSALNVLIDALAYNTMYYGFYSNMIANELYLDTAQRIESLISITKPLGFTVRAAVASRAVVDLTNLPSRIPQYSKFIGTDETGASFNFYTLASYDRDWETK